ncbi:hypothetical protein HanRHA438_Chr01g0004731 [Helianthus annuus]|nr:hypothetical protein HanRHA438_Chr01g0004731 [Helianthus annuus]
MSRKFKYSNEMHTLLPNGLYHTPPPPPQILISSLQPCLTNVFVSILHMPHYQSHHNPHQIHHSPSPHHHGFGCCKSSSVQC